MKTERSLLVPELTIDQYLYYMKENASISREDLIQRFKDFPTVEACSCAGKKFNNGDGTSTIETIRIKRP